MKNAKVKSFNNCWGQCKNTKWSRPSCKDDRWTYGSALWTQGIVEKIPNRESDFIHAVYMDYESDYTGDYTLVLGCRVKSSDDVPVSMVAVNIENR